MLNIGLIGCGGMGTTHNLSLKALSEQRDIQVTALADCRPEKLQKAAELWPQARLYTTGMELLEKETLDVADICLPSYLHADHGVAALHKGMHTFIEKPVCLTEADGQRLLQAEAASGCKVMVGQVLRSAPEYLFLKDAFDSRRYGALRSLILQRTGSDVRWGFEDWFHDEAKSGSVVLDLHVHDLDFLRYMLGEPDQFCSTAAAFANGMPSQIVTTYRFGPVFACAEGCWDISPDLPFEAAYRASFQQATVVWQSRAAQPLTVYFADGRVEHPALRPEYEAHSSAAGINITNLGPYYAELKYFIDCILQDRPVERAPLVEGVRSVRQGLRELAAAHRFLDGAAIQVEG